MSTKPKTAHTTTPTAKGSTFKSTAPSVFDALPDSAFIREAQLVQSPKRPGSTAPLPFSAPTLWRKVRDGSFVKPVKLSERVTAWNVGKVRAWIAAQTQD